LAKSEGDAPRVIPSAARNLAGVSCSMLRDMPLGSLAALGMTHLRRGFARCSVAIQGTERAGGLYL